MDKQILHHISRTQSFEKNKALCEKTLRTLFRTKEKLNQPLSDFSEKEVRALAEQIRTISNVMRNLPPEILNEYLRSREVVLQSLHNTVIKLNLAGDQLISSEDKASFYKYLLSSQEDFSEIFICGLSESANLLNITTFIASVSNPPATPPSSYKVMLKFSQSILPALCALFQGTDSIGSDECEQALINMKTIEALFENPDTILSSSCIPFYESDEYAALTYRLDVALAYAVELTQKLTYLFSLFQSRCHSQSKQSVRTKEEISYYLTLFSYHYDTLLQKTLEIYTLQDRARFLHKHLSLVKEEHTAFIQG